MAFLLAAAGLDNLVQGFTNIPLALHDGRITSEALERVASELGELRYSVVHASEQGIDLFVKYMDRETYIHYIDIFGITRHMFSYTTGQLTSETGKRDPPRTTWHDRFSLSAAQREERWLKGQQSRNRFYEIMKAAENARSENLAEVAAVLESVQVYLGDPETVKVQTGKQVSFVELRGPQQFIEGVSQAVLQVATYLAGGNAVIAYQRASPARGTPVILS
ncbi:hypothetical protein HYY73_06620 [Candidatus Woesearchaeota archaeon]|nr:hypothetical protein [Candidatus Woesearchaeota archaeon]